MRGKLEAERLKFCDYANIHFVGRRTFPQQVAVQFKKNERIFLSMRASLERLRW